MDEERPIAIVIIQGRHSHPPWPLEKPTHDARADLAKCVEAYGAMDATGGRINNGKSLVIRTGYADRTPTCFDI
jgi:hypothetical protein